MDNRQRLLLILRLIDFDEAICGHTFSSQLEATIKNNITTPYHHLLIMLYIPSLYSGSKACCS